MFASSSTSLARAIAPSVPLSTRAFSSSSVVETRRRILVELLQDHERLGRTYDRVLVAPGYARQQLVPYRIARIVPYAGLLKIKPYRHTPSATTYARVQGPTNPAPSTPVTEATPKSLLDSLHALPDTLTFPLRTIDHNSPTLHGSLTLPDIVQRLGELGLSEGDVEVSWTDPEVGDRMKQVGQRTAVVQVRGKGRESINVQIRVISLNSVSLL